MERQDLLNAIEMLLNDVIEQCFHHLVNHPQESIDLNEIVREATQERAYLTIKVDAHGFEDGSAQARSHCEQISKTLHKKSLQLMGRLQDIKGRHQSNVAGDAGAFDA